MRLGRPPSVVDAVFDALSLSEAQAPTAGHGNLETYWAVQRAANRLAGQAQGRGPIQKNRARRLAQHDRPWGDGGHYGDARSKGSVLDLQTDTRPWMNRAMFSPNPSDQRSPEYSYGGFGLGGFEDYDAVDAFPQMRTDYGPKMVVAAGLHEIARAYVTTVSARLEQLQHLLTSDPTSHYQGWAPAGMAHYPNPESMMVIHRGAPRPMSAFSAEEQWILYKRRLPVAEWLRIRFEAHTAMLRSKRDQAPPGRDPPSEMAYANEASKIQSSARYQQGFVDLVEWLWTYHPELYGDYTLGTRTDYEQEARAMRDMALLTMD